MRELGKLCERWAAAYSLPSDRVKAMVQVESQGNVWAMRYEPRFRDWLKRRIKKVYGSFKKDPWVDHPFDPEVTELAARSTSWGPMQIMGQTAREAGFRGPYLTELCGEQGIRFGCKHLATLKDRHRDLDAATEAYNAGRPGTKAGKAYLSKIKQAERRLAVLVTRGG